MHKLIILIEQVQDEALFDEMWPQFLHVSERMPGLQQEATCRVEHLLYGARPVYLIHELFFDSLASIQAAMSAPEGRAAGELLQKMSGGKLTLLIADHKQDDLDNIRSHQQAGLHGDTPA
jgi:uncharacterized protein (TIGR02118 family)